MLIAHGKWWLQDHSDRDTSISGVSSSMTNLRNEGHCHVNKGRHIYDGIRKNIWKQSDHAGTRSFLLTSPIVPTWPCQKQIQAKSSALSVIEII